METNAWTLHIIKKRSRWAQLKFIAINLRPFYTSFQNITLHILGGPVFKTAEVWRDWNNWIVQWNRNAAQNVVIVFHLKVESVYKNQNWSIGAKDDFLRPSVKRWQMCKGCAVLTVKLEFYHFWCFLIVCLTNKFLVRFWKIERVFWKA